jgi:hypothetical protein
MLEAIFLSFVIINIFLVIADVKWSKKYQWPMGRFLKYIFLGGVIGFFVAIVFVVTWTLIYKGSQGPMAIIFFGPFFFAVGELAGFWLFTWLEARKRKRVQASF